MISPFSSARIRVRTRLMSSSARELNRAWPNILVLTQHESSKARDGSFSSHSQDKSTKPKDSVHLDCTNWEKKYNDCRGVQKKGKGKKDSLISQQGESGFHHFFRSFSHSSHNYRYIVLNTFDPLSTCVVFSPTHT